MTDCKLKTITTVRETVCVHCYGCHFDEQISTDLKYNRQQIRNSYPHKSYSYHLIKSRIYHYLLRKELINYR